MYWLPRSVGVAVACFVATSPTLSAQWFDPRLRKAAELIDDGQTDDAVELIEVCLKAHPGDPEGEFQMARARACRNDADAAIASLDRAIERGFASDARNVERIESDRGLAALRGDPRYDRLLDLARARAWLEWNDRTDASTLPSEFLDWCGGHWNYILSARFSPDETKILTAGHDATVRISDARTGEPLALLGGHWTLVTEAVWSPDGEQIATASQDGAVRIFDARGGKVLHVFQLYARDVNSVRYDDRGRRVAASGWGGDVFVVDVESEKTLLKIPADPQGVNSTTATFSPDGSLLATGGFFGGRIWDSRTGEPRSDWMRLPAVPDHYCWSSDGTLLTSGAPSAPVDVHVARVVLARTGEILATMPNGDYRSTIASFDDDAARLVTGSGTGFVRVWDLQDLDPNRRPAKLVEWKGHDGPVRDAQFDSAGARILTASADRSTKIWDASNGELLLRIEGRRLRIPHVGFSPDARRIVMVDRATSETSELDAATGRPCPPIGRPGRARAHGTTRYRAAWVCGCTEPAAYDWTHGSTDVAEPWILPREKVVSIVVNGAADRVYLVTDSGDAELWEPRSSSAIKQLFQYGRPQLSNPSRLEFGDLAIPIQFGAFSPDDSLLVTCGYEESVVRVWDGRTGAKKHDLRDHRGFVMNVRFSPDGSILATAADDGDVLLWDAKTLARRGRPLSGHLLGTAVLAFSPDGRTIATGDGAGSVRLFEVESGELLLKIRAHRDEIASGDFSADGRRLVTSAVDGTIRMWDPSNGRPLGTFSVATDGGWLSFTDSLYFDGSPADVAKARLYLNGVPYPLDLFEKTLHRPDRVAASLRGEIVEKAPVQPPPTLVVSHPSADELTTPERWIPLEATASDPLIGIDRIEVTVDGKRLGRETAAAGFAREVDGLHAKLSTRIEFPAGKDVVAVEFQAVNARNVCSRAQSFTIRHVSPKRDLYLLAMGVGDYEDPSLQLTCPVHDVDDLIAAFKKQEHDFYDEVKVERLVDSAVTTANIRKAREEFLLKANPEDTIVVFAAGHAWVTAVDEYWFLTQKATPKNHYEGIPGSELDGLVTWERLRARRRVLLKDTCFSGEKLAARGAAPLPSMQPAADPGDDMRSGLYILAATSYRDYALEQNGNGTFTRALVDGLAGAADMKENGGDGDAYIEIQELQRFAEHEVNQRSGGRQRPTMPDVRGGENFRLARRLTSGR